MPSFDVYVVFKHVSSGYFIPKFIGKMLTRDAIRVEFKETCDLHNEVFLCFIKAEKKSRHTG